MENVIGNAGNTSFNDNLENTKQAFKDAGKAVAGAAKCAVTELKYSGKNLADEVVESVGGQSSCLLSITRARIVEEPVKSVLMVAGLGFLIGYLMRRH